MGLKDVDDLFMQHKSLCDLFTNEFKKHKEFIKEPHVGIKFQLLPLMCLDGYANVNQDIIFLLAYYQQQNKYKNVYGFT